MNSIPELRYTELGKLMELYHLIRETPDGACNRLNVEQRAMILADVDSVMDGCFGIPCYQPDRDQQTLMILEMIDRGVLPLKKYLRGVM